MKWVSRFARFWYDFVVGDDWLLAAGVAVGILAVDLLQRARHDWWWLLPIAVVVTLGVSLRRARTERSGTVTEA